MKIGAVFMHYDGDSLEFHIFQLAGMKNVCGVGLIARYVITIFIATEFYRSNKNEHLDSFTSKKYLANCFSFSF